MMKEKWKLLLICLGTPLAIGGLSALLSGGMSSYSQINQPPLSPPGWVFPMVWTVLYLAMGLAFYLVVTSGAAMSRIKPALVMYGLQLFVNFCWSIFFFRFSLYLFSFIWLILLWVLILLTMVRFAKIREWAGKLLSPYLLWVTFAGYLNLGVYLLN